MEKAHFVFVFIFVFLHFIWDRVGWGVSRLSRDSQISFSLSSSSSGNIQSFSQPSRETMSLQYVLGLPLVLPLVGFAWNTSLGGNHEAPLSWLLSTQRSRDSTPISSQVTELLKLSLRVHTATLRNSLWPLLSAITSFGSLATVHDHRWQLERRLTGNHNLCNIV